MPIKGNVRWKSVCQYCGKASRGGVTASEKVGPPTSNPLPIEGRCTANPFGGTGHMPKWEIVAKY